MKSMLSILVLVPVAVLGVDSKREWREVIFVGKTGYGDFSITVSMPSETTADEAIRTYARAFDERRGRPAFATYKGFLFMYPKLSPRRRIFDRDSSTVPTYYMAG